MYILLLGYSLYCSFFSFFDTIFLVCCLPEAYRCIWLYMSLRVHLYAHEVILDYSN